MMNWNLGQLSASLDFFIGLGMQQIVAGYYDSGDGTGSAQSELSSANGKTGIFK